MEASSTYRQMPLSSLLEALTRSIALEVAKYGITVNCIEPEDITETILFLASMQARMLMGQVIKVSGGHTL